MLYHRLVIPATAVQESARKLDDTRLVRRFLLPFLVAASIWYLLSFLVVASLRASFPMQLEWVESGVLDAVARVFAHQPVYVAPTHVFVPYLYTPLYYHAGALLCRIAGLGFTPLRWLSILCTLGCLALIFELTRQFTGSRQTGLIAAGCFAALYGASAAPSDIARVDMLFLLLILAAIYVFWRQQSLLAGALFACAYQSKQGAAIIAVCVCLSAWRRPRHYVVTMMTFVVLTGASTLVMNRISGGWYGFYTLWLPSHQPLDMYGVFSFVARDLGRYLLPGLLLIACSVPRDPRPLWQSREAHLLLATAVGTFLTALAGRAHSGGSANSTLPLYAWFAVMFGVALHRQFAGERQPSSQALLPGRARLTATLAALQFLIGFTLPSRWLPSEQAWQQARDFTRQIAAVPGDIYVIDAAADLIPAHKTSFANGVPVWDIIRAGDSAAGRTLVADLQQSLHQHRYAALLSPYSPQGGQLHFIGSPGGLSADYRLEVPPLYSGTAARDMKIIQTPQIGPLYLFPVRK